MAHNENKKIRVMSPAYNFTYNGVNKGVAVSIERQGELIVAFTDNVPNNW